MLVLKPNGPPPSPFALSISDPISQVKQVRDKGRQGGGSDKKSTQEYKSKHLKRKEGHILWAVFLEAWPFHPSHCLLWVIARAALFNSDLEKFSLKFWVILIIGTNWGLWFKLNPSHIIRPLKRLPDTHRLPFQLLVLYRSHINLELSEEWKLLSIHVNVVIRILHIWPASSWSKHVIS